MSTATLQSVKPEVVYVSKIQVEPRTGGLKMVHLPVDTEPVPMGMFGAVAEHYKVPEGTYTPHATALDYVVGAAAACLMGTLNRALQVRKIATDSGRLTSEAFGEVEVEDGVLVIRRIRIVVHLCAPESQRDAVERVIPVYASGCPVYRSIHKAIDITTELDFQPIPQ
jgi:organic hydroperoxide reductase OsmC/OhrA